ncbi:carbohydrate binding family 9 domain-containing protein [Alteromonas gracilis]|uniref:carbohydrate binding family 9 domain-containing protein n=1 Tax=Alteromonas gracilis TaxID=1479524 RepID=UPI00321B7683
MSTSQTQDNNLGTDSTIVTERKSDVVSDDSDTLIVPFLEASVELDGIIDEPVWKQAATVPMTFVTRPFENTTPPVETTARIFENGEKIFIAFTAQDNDVSQLRALFRDRDRVWDNDLVGVKIDTFGDSRLSYQFFVNPRGIQIDAIENQMTRSESTSWNAIWDAEATITEEGYNVEIALPFRILNFLDSDGPKRWRAEFVRFYPRENNLRISNRPVDRNNACALCLMGDMEGFASAKQGKNLSITPYVVAGNTRNRAPSTVTGQSTDWQYENNQEVGVDVNWGISSDMLLQATINPDFSQVEADAGQLGINNPFALFFPEQRPFFLENADFFSTQYDLVYTRNIGAPDIGTKLTGRINNHTFGILAANDESTTFLVPGNLGSSVARLDEESTNIAARYRYDISEDLSFGAIVT